MEITKQYPDELDADTAYALLEAVVTEAGEDYAYMAPNGWGYVYVDDGKPSCLVGRALALYGVPLEVLWNWDGQVNQQVTAVDTGPWLTNGARWVFGAAQDAQDSRCTWAKALAAAKAALDTLKVDAA